MIVPASERGAALLTVLLLVAVMATVAATALDRIAIATRLTGNAATVAQGHQWLAMAEQLTATRMEDLLAADRGKTVAGSWLGTPRTIALPDGGRIRARVRDAGNCFNLNGLVTRAQDGSLVANQLVVAQFTGLMGQLGIDSGRAAGIAQAAADWIDSDFMPQPQGAEDSAYAGGGRQAANAAMADVSELRAVVGVTNEAYVALRPWICALPVHEPSSLNVNTLLPEQALLLAMLAPQQIGVAQARAQLAGRPVEGFSSTVDFWKSGAFADLTVPPEAASQVKLRSAWFLLEAEVGGRGLQLGQTSLIDAREKRARVVRRAYGELR
ncbi:type II secretion system minor pseudopilin GspK [uncultured Sphingomonas sp.]|uniref:type II secretion system minor pseudopilin GspK n=1 Tax=uncultured Sphingomonas sp. TaxID=158754 RepID=UPI0025D957A3|nr:type II secretion system minor pseudopilin GspK [uncultured Sphingomonas sp.]